MNNVVPITSNVPRAYNASQLDLIRRTVAKDTTNDEFNMFVEVCKNMRLDPFRKQLYCIVYSKDNPNKRKVAFITGIDGFRAVAERNGNYRPDNEPTHFETDNEAKDPDTNPLGLISATVKGFKQDKSGEWFPVVATAYWEEFAPLSEVWEWDDVARKKQPTGKFKLDGNWGRMGRVMLAKCAEAQMLRKGWPEDLSGVHAPEEMDAMAKELTATEEIEEYQKIERTKRIGGNDTIMFLWRAGDALENVPIGQVADRCAEFVGKAQSPTELDKWRKTNAEGLKQFWAKQPNDALDLKAMIEKKLTELESA